MNINNTILLQTIYNCNYKFIYLIVCFTTSWSPSIHVRLVGGTSNMIHFGCYIIFLFIKIERMVQFKCFKWFKSRHYVLNCNICNLKCKCYSLPYRYIIITVWFAIITQTYNELLCVIATKKPYRPVVVTSFKSY